MRLSWLVVLLACCFLVPGAHAIEIAFSAEDGGDSFSFSGSFGADIKTPVSGEISVSPDLSAIYLTGEFTSVLSGFCDMNAYEPKTYKSTNGVFDCTCFKVPTQVLFPRVY